MNETVYVTGTIPYVNGRPHVGHALQLVQADAIARYHRGNGHRVRFQTGADENAFKNLLSACNALTNGSGLRTQVLESVNP